MSLKVQDDQFCYVCGKKNAHGFRLDFEQPGPDILKSSVVFKKEHQGYAGIVHGGLIATMLDEMMVNLAWKENAPAVTAELNVRLKKAARVGEKILLEGRIERRTEKILYTSAVATNEKGDILATATASCVRVRNGG